MVVRFGDRSTFAIELGAHLEVSRSLRIVDLWGAGHWLTCEDHTAFVPQLCLSIERTLQRWGPRYDRGLPWPERSPEENHRRLYAGDYDGRSPHVFLTDWGPTTDSIESLVFRVDDDLLMTFALRDASRTPGEVLVARAPADALPATLRAAVSALRAPE